MLMQIIPIFAMLAVAQSTRRAELPSAEYPEPVPCQLVEKDWKINSYDYGCGCGAGTSCFAVNCEMNEWGDWGACWKWDSDTKTHVQLAIGVVHALLLVLIGVCDEGAPKVTGGSQIRRRTVKVKPQYGGRECPAHEEARSCNSHTCVDKDCIVSEWSDWGECSKQCGGGVRRRTRSVVQAAQNNGAKCPARAEKEACNTDYCYYFKLKGKSGSEVVQIENRERTYMNSWDGKFYKLSKNKWQTFGSNSHKVTIKYDNDNGNRDVIFSYATSPVTGEKSGGFPPVSVRKWKGWKCGEDNESSKCQRIRDGYFSWNGVYGIYFLERKN